MTENKKMTKREFLTHLSVLAGSAFIAAKTLVTPAYAQEKRRGAKPAAGPKKDTDLPLVEPGKGTAAALAYYHSHKDAEKDPKTDKKTDKGTVWEQRFCNNCSFYTSVGSKDGQEVGKCTLFPNSLVNSIGICNSWAKK